jgi:hypothetical protein
MTTIQTRPAKKIGMIFFAIAIVILIVVAFMTLAGCTPQPAAKPEAPLATGASVAPPATCVALRKKGGSC